MRSKANTQQPTATGLGPLICKSSCKLSCALLILRLPRFISLLALSLGQPCRAGDDVVDKVPPQIKAAQETALQWWRQPDNRISVARSTHTDAQGVQHLRVVFILRDPQGRPLACAGTGGREVHEYWREQLSVRLSQLQQEYSLSGSDLEKLSLAAAVDIARFQRRVQEAEQLLITPEVRHNSQRINQLFNPIEADCSKQGLFNERSLYRRVLATLLAGN